MDLYKHRYYRLNKFMLTLIGQWPEQPNRVRRGCHTVLSYFYVSEILSRARSIYNLHGAGNSVMDAWLPIFQQMLLVTCFITYMLNSQTTLKLLNRIRTDWQMWAREWEVDILHAYTDLGRKINIVFAVGLYSSGIMVITEPAIEKIIDILLKNGTEPGKFIFLIDYYHIDEQKHYFYVTIYFTIMCIVTTVPAITQFVMLISYTLHGSGLFAALRYVKLIDAAYTWNTFVLTGIGMVVINVIGLQILKDPYNLQVTLTGGGYALAMGGVFLLESIASEVLIDHSISIRVYIYNSLWYRLSTKAQKFLQSMIMRSNVPSQLTAGNMLIMSMRTVLLMIKTAVSYFAFVRSTQGL